MTDAPSNPPKHGAVLFACDLPRVAAFYRELLGMTQTVTERRLIVLESASYQLVIHGIAKQIADRMDITTPPKRRVDLPVKLVFAVHSLSEARVAAVALGGGLDAVSGQFSARGFTACDGFDPEGNVVQFRQSAH